jgi:hypothetical protein
LLPWIAVARMPSRSSCWREPVGTVLGPREDQRLVDPAGLDEVAEELALPLAVDHVNDLGHELGGGIARRDLDRGRVVEQSVGKASDVVGEGSREEQVLTTRRQHGKDLADVADEAHVKHPVGLVEDEDLDPRQVDGALADGGRAGGRASRRRSPGPARKRADLRVEADAAVDRGRADRGSGRRTSGRSPRPGARARAVGVRIRRTDARGPLAGRDAMEALEHRQHERGRLAGPGLGARRGTSRPVEDERDGLCLDGGGFRVALVGDGTEELGRQPESIEGHGVRLLTRPSRFLRGPVRARCGSGRNGVRPGR